jgi:hypothetical protein
VSGTFYELDGCHGDAALSIRVDFGMMILTFLSACMQFVMCLRYYGQLDSSCIGSNLFVLVQSTEGAWKG